MQTIVLYLCYIVLVLLFSTAYVFNILFWIRCLHTDKRRPSSTLSGHSSSSFYFSFVIWVSGCQTRQQHCCFCNGRWLRSKWLVLGLKWGSQFRMSCHHPELGTWLRTPWGVDCTVLAKADWQASEHFLPFFLPSFLPCLLACFLPSFLPACLRSCLSSCLPAFRSSFLPSLLLYYQ